MCAIIDIQDIHPETIGRIFQSRMLQVVRVQKNGPKAVKSKEFTRKDNKDEFETIGIKL